MNDTQTLRNAIEAAGVQSIGGSGPIYNDARKDGTRRLKLAEAGYFQFMPLEVQWLIHDYLQLLFGERFVTVYLHKNFDYAQFWWGEPPVQNKFSLCVVLRDY